MAIIVDEYQRRTLEQLFSQTSKPSAPQREAVAEALNLPVRAVQTWFAERRTKAKADKRIEELQTRTALENAHHISSREVSAIPTNQNTNHKTQSDASYASLARSLAAAAACMPQPDALYDRSYPSSPVFHLNMGFPMYSPTNSSFDTSASMVRSDSQYSNFSATTNGDLDQPDYSFFPDHSGYMPTPATNCDTMVYDHLEMRPSTNEMHRSRPRLQRTWTAPESLQQRPLPRRTIVSTSPGDVPQATEPVLIRRRPKLSPLGIGMARSRSSLGYEQSEYPYSVRRATALSDFPCPMTPVRRIASAAAVPTMATMRSFSTTSQDSTGTKGDSGLASSIATQDCLASNIQFPPSPISPEHNVHGTPSSAYKITSFELPHLPIGEDSFTPPPTPLSALTGSAENALAGGYEDTWTSDFSKLSGLDLTNNDLIIADLFHDQEMGVVSF